MCRFFTECLAWTHGVQFMCLAPQNRMAALIGGTTLHTWGEVPIDTGNQNFGGGRKTKQGYSERHSKCCSLRWLIIDEISATGLMLLGVVERYARQGCAGQPYAKDGNGQERCFGGLNLVTCGDCAYPSTPSILGKLAGRLSSQRVLDP